MNKRGMVIAVAVACFVLTASAAAAATGPHLAVRPRVGSTRTHFVVSFTAQQTGWAVASWSGYRVVVSGGSAQTCGTSEEVAVPPTRENQRVHVTLAPSGCLHGWCRGRYSGRLEKVVRPTCGYRELCPLVARSVPVFVGIVTDGRFGFRVN